MAQCTTAGNPRQLSPVQIEARWLTLPCDATMTADVAITDAKMTKFYAFAAHLDQRTGEIMGYRLTTADGRTYDLDPTGTWGWQCDCPDGLFRGNRPGGCRHVQAVRQLLAALDDELAAAERARLEREQEQDRAGEPLAWPSDEELADMAAEYGAEEAAAVYHDGVAVAAGDNTQAIWFGQ